MKNLAWLGSVAIAAMLASQAIGQEHTTQMQLQKPAEASISAEDQPTDDQLARLVQAMRMRDQMASMMKQFTGMLQQQISDQVKASQVGQPADQAMTPDQQEAMTALINKYMEKAMNLYQVDEMIQDLSAIYKRHLSREDVDGMIAFYSSPAGQHLIDILPVIMREYSPVAMSRVQERFKALSDEMQLEIKKLAVSQAAPAKK